MISQDVLPQKRESVQSAIAIHVEDHKDWRDEVKSYIYLKDSTLFKEIIQGSSVEEVSNALEEVSGPVVIIIDLRIDHVTPSFEGYFWLLEHWAAFSKKHRQSAIFVISGQLHEGIIQTLIRKGIPANHIYDKAKWSEQRDDFISALKDALGQMDIDISVATGNIDAHLKHWFQHIASTLNADKHIDDSAVNSILPMLVKANSNHWEPDGVPKLQILGNIENIYACFGTEETIQHLEKDSNVLKVEASHPVTHYDCHISVPFVNAPVVYNNANERGNNSIIAFVDSGIDILHKAFRKSDGTTRIVAIWDQRDKGGPPPRDFGIGKEYDEAEINRFIEADYIPKELNIGKNDHGTHVASIAAGRPTEHFAGGIAPDASIVMVIPSTDAAPGNLHALGYSNSHLLALKYIRSFAASKNLPVVINVSQGQNAGAHDGTSNLEKAFDAITNNGQEPGIVVVKSAGNERDKRIHAKLKMVSNSQEVLKWKTKVTYPGKDIIELWFKASNELKFRLVDPKNESSTWVTRANSTASGYFRSGNTHRITFTRFDPDNGDSRVIIWVTSGSDEPVEIGEWALEIVSENIKAEGEIHAWLERNGSRSTEFLNHLDEEVTLSIPGTANHVISVGSVAAYLPVKLSAFSSYGPTRDGRKKPDLAAPGENISAAASKSETGIITLSGTSMAAPHVTGAIALLLSHSEKRIAAGLENQRLNSAQIQAAIIQGVMNYSGSWNRGLGYGILDVEAFFRELGFV